ncbi:MAG: hypothetical protein LQ343_006917 [Gyalolechia ehrenbergii]|nr:MAG: hypothetical protein LQ343_006917 [Gyalolechia ehrenbergii]
MISSMGMETFEARLQSFSAVHASNKKRNSNSKGAGKLKWPHKSPAPAQLARAGFFYKPTSSKPDNTTCYLCHSNLGGWEEDDDAIGEHINLSPGCGWAALVRIEQDIEKGRLEQKDPVDENLLNARKMTFGTMWPHEDKRGWLCKTQKMSEAGWYYCPTAESDDYVKCCYCNLGVDGWEPKDDPYNEHQRRSPGCKFFAVSKSNSKKTARGKKGRPSKTSRVSTQSNITAASKDISMIDVMMHEDNSSLGRELESVETSKPTKGAKKGVKRKKGASKSKQKPSTFVQEQDMAGSNIAEPEDDNFEIKTQQEPQQTTNAKKRKSDELSIDENATRAEVQADHSQQLPPTKRRATRSSVSYANKASDASLAAYQEDESNMSDTENMAMHSIPISKKAAKGQSKRGSASVRKASTTSTASKASLRATVPDNEELDAALEADLDRPLTDDEVDLDPPAVTKTKTRRLTRTRPGSRNVIASTAPVRRATRASAIIIEGESMTSVDTPAYDLNDEDVRVPKAVEITVTTIDHAQEIIAETDKHKSSKAETRARAPSKACKATEKEVATAVDGHGLNGTKGIQQESLVTKSSTKELPSPKESKQPAETTFRRSERSVGGIVGDDVSALNSSGLAPAEVNEGSTEVNEGLAEVNGGSANETHAGRTNQSRARKVGRPRNAVAKNGKAVKNGAAASRKLDQEIQVGKEHTERNNPVVVAVNIEIPNNQGSTEEPKLPEDPEDKDGIASKPSKQAARSPITSKMPPPDSMIIEWTEPVESLVTAHETQVTVGIATPADSQGQDEDPKTPVQSPSLRVPTPSVQATPKMVTSPQSSDAENRPPSSRPSALRPPLLIQTPSKTGAARIPLAATTPTASPSKRNISRLQTTLPWDPIDFKKIFNSPLAEKENVLGGRVDGTKQGLSSPEKNLTIEEWIRWTAERGEERLREDCEKLVGRFEGEGLRALKTLEGIVCTE